MSVDVTRFPIERQELISIPDFLNHLFANIPGENYIEFTVILPPELAHVGPSPITYSYHIGYEQPDYDHFHKLNSESYGIYYGLCPKRSRRKSGRAHENDASYCPVLWVDIDLKDGVYSTKREAYQAIIDLDVPATAIIDSGGGLHALWRINPVKVDSTSLPHIKQTLRGLAMALRADPHCAELARVFRLPGTINTKPDRNGARCEVIDFLDGQIDYSYFEDFHHLAEPVRKSVKFSAAVPEGLTLTLPQWVKDYLVSGAPNGERNNRLFAATIEYRVNGYSRVTAEQDLVSRAMSDGLSEAESLRTIESAWRSSLGTPNLPEHIKIRKAAYNG